MPNSAILRSTDPDIFYGAIRNAQVEGVVTGRGDFQGELTRIDLLRLWMLRGAENLPRTANVPLVSEPPFCSRPVEVNSDTSTARSCCKARSLHTAWICRTSAELGQQSMGYHVLDT